MIYYKFIFKIKLISSLTELTLPAKEKNKILVNLIRTATDCIDGAALHIIFSANTPRTMQ